MPPKRRQNKSKNGSKNTVLKVETQQLSLLKEIKNMQLADLAAPISVVNDVKVIELSEKVYTFSRSVFRNAITATSASVPVLGALPFLLTDLPDYVEFTALFDEFKIQQVIVQFTPTNYSQAYASLFTAIDYDDASSPSSINDLREYGSFHFTPALKYHQRVLTPKYSYRVYNGVGITDSFASTRGWVDCSKPDTPWYGLKYAFGPTTVIPSVGTPVGEVYEVQCTYIVCFRFYR